MRFLKSLLGGILGSAIGVFAYNGVSQNLATPWAVLIIGLAAGLGVRLLCGANRSGLTGIVAATTALTALLGFNYSVIANAQQSSDPVIAEHVKFDEDGRPIPLEEDETAADDESESEGAAEQDEETQGAFQPVAIPNTLSDGKPLQVADVFTQPNMAMVRSSPMDIAAIVLTGLLAYLLGRGNANTVTNRPSMAAESAPSTA